MPGYGSTNIVDHLARSKKAFPWRLPEFYRTADWVIASYSLDLEFNVG